MKKTFVKKACIIVAALMLLSACLSGCSSNEKGFPLPLSPTEKSAFEMCTTMYTDVQLGEIYNYMAEEKDVDKLDKKYEIQCLRKTDDGYKAFYVSTKKFLIFSFDKNAKFIEEERKVCERALLKSVADFDAIKVGDSVHIVQTVDQKSYIPFLAGVEGAFYSDHYTEDGYHVHIVYDEGERVSSIDITPA